MGANRRKRERFFATHSVCCFCGGLNKATQIDHIPSRACFDDRVFPDGFEFPACDSCNSSTSNEEQWVALLSHVLSHPGEATKPDQISRYIKGVANNLPTLFSKTRPLWRTLGGGLVEIPAAHQEISDVVFAKWAKAFYYQETGAIVPVSASISTTIYMNIDADKIPYQVFTGKQHLLQSGKRSLASQMELYSMCDAQRGHGLFGVTFRRSFCAVMVVQPQMIVSD